jgi:hypothetical protein
MKRNLIIGCMIFGLLVCTQSVEARYDYELAYGQIGQSSGFRGAADMDDWLERGRAAVTESPVFADGTRITAWGGARADEPGLASAIYYFSVPRGAQYLTINIRYKDTAQDDTIAARLWIKSIDTDMRGTTGVGEEAPFYGDTFVLRSERSSESITVPTSRHVEGGMVEMHVVASGSDCIDVRDIRVEYLYTKPQITVVHRTCNDYWDMWPRYRYAYHYYYWGPLFWPKTYIVYECWDVPSRFYWVTWRPWFFVNIIHVHYHQPWWGPRRYMVVYHVDVKQPLIKRTTLLRKILRERYVHVTKIIRPNPEIRKIYRPAPVHTHLPQGQEVRSQKEAQPPRTFETRVDQNSKQQTLKKQPVRMEKEGKEIPKAATKITVAPARGHNTGQLAQEKQERGRSSADTRIKTVKDPHVVKTADPRAVRSPDTAPERIKKEPPQPHTVEQQPRSRSVAREPVQEPAKVQVSRGDSAKQEPTVQRRAGIEEKTKLQAHQGVHQERPQPGQRRNR